jgi:hypothetical protein
LLQAIGLLTAFLPNIEPKNPREPGGRRGGDAA